MDRPDGDRFAARVPLHIPADARGKIGVAVRVRSVEGKIGLGVFDRISEDIQAEVTVLPSSEPTRIWVPVLAPGRAASLIFRNLAGSSSQILVDEIAVVRRSGAQGR